ncbi:hypothetical protein [Ralstonia sp. RL]|uniref:hypothetical protein n=1 Tax=Ralstonia sp. RL TaxID=1839756 RepID=UPI00257F4F41|nr:hypothetical protein [Ralstonia sp. RL]
MYSRKRGRLVASNEAAPLSAIMQKMSEMISQRKVSFPVSIGIFFAPYVFSWLTLRAGYSQKTKIVAFAWMAFVLLLISSNRQKIGQESIPLTVKESHFSGPLSGKQQTPEELIRQWAVDMPEEQIRTVCAANAIGAIAFASELKNGEFVSAQAFADNVLSMPNDIAPKYRSTAELTLKVFHNTLTREQEKYRSFIHDRGVDAFADGANQACRQLLRKTLGR